ncbi:hypothetical protein LMG26684_05734 [Achromobacter mucicolens]|nr:hypothetical protein LMG26684_05734 [Achromobacter mucicolens]
MLSIMKSMCPATRSVMAGPLPLYGTCSAWMPVCCLSSSPASCAGEPLPGEPNDSLPGLARAYCRNSCSVFTGIDFVTTIRLCSRSRQVMGARSLAGLNGMLAYRLGLTTVGPAAASSSV